ncbi:hypothetical protein [Leptolyngbya sp. BC1307]|nr:hypothetical protein [Leptolyngbya sp. BC1307]
MTEATGPEQPNAEAWDEDRFFDEIAGIGVIQVTSDVGQERAVCG